MATARSGPANLMVSRLQVLNGTEDTEASVDVSVSSLSQFQSGSFQKAATTARSARVTDSSAPNAHIISTCPKPAPLVKPPSTEQTP